MRRRAVLALLAWGILPLGAGCGVHITQSRAFTITGVAAIESAVSGGPSDFGEQRLTGADVIIFGPNAQGTQIVEVAHGATDGLGQFGIIVPHNLVPARSSFTYPWAVQVTAQVYVNEVPHTVKLQAAFNPAGQALVQRNVGVASTIVARNLDPWLRTNPNPVVYDQSLAQKAVAYAETATGAGASATIQDLESRTDALLSSPPASFGPVSLDLLADLDSTTSAATKALTESIVLAVNGSQAASTAAAGTASLGSGRAADVVVRATQGGAPVGWAIDLVNYDDPAGAGLPATVVGMAQTGPSSVRLTGARTGAARIDASIGGNEGKLARLNLNVTP